MNTTTGRRVVVVGAGITGLATAHRLMVDRPGLEVSVMEAAPVAGGRLVTTPFAGLPECGRGAGQDQGGGPTGMPGNEFLSHHAAHGMTHDHRPGRIQMIQ